MAVWFCNFIDNKKLTKKKMALYPFIEYLYNSNIITP